MELKDVALLALQLGKSFSETLTFLLFSSSLSQPVAFVR